MKYMRFVLFCILFRVCFMINNGTSDVHVQFIRQRNTWFEAQQQCELKGGRLATDKDSTLTCEKIEGVINSDKGSTFWSGRYATMAYWISREGCYNISNINDMSHSLSLSKCFEVCRYQNTFLHSFAYRSRDKKCACLHSNARVIPYAGYNCSDFLRSNTTYLKYIIVPNNAFNSTGNCAFVDCKNGYRMVASTCNDKRRPFCGSSQEDFNWETSQEKCKDTIPINTTNICKEISHNDRNGIWLPIQKVALLVDISDDGIVHDQDVTKCKSYRCYKGHEGTKANTACKNTTDGFFCLFYKGNETRNVTTNQQKTTNFILKHIKKNSTEYVEPIATSNTGKKLITTINTNTETTKRTTVVKMVHSVPSNSTDYLKHVPSSETGLVVGGVVGAVLLIVAIVLIVVLKIRCKNATSKKENEQSSTYKDHNKKTSSTNEKMFNNRLYDEQCSLPCKIVPDENITKETNDRKDCSRHNDVYSAPMKTKKVDTSTQAEYSKDGYSVESEYDILNKTPKSLNSILEHNIYDTTIASRCESDPTYNTAANIMSNRAYNDEMYDRL